MTTSHPATQSPAARRSAESQLRALIATLAHAHARPLAAFRRSLRKRLPTAHELVYEYRDAIVISYTPTGRGHEGVLALRASPDGLKLYFNQGKALPDPEKLLRGSANARWIPLDAPSTLSHPPVAALIDAALARNPVPFPPTGRGPVLIRPTSASAKPRRPRRPA